jgi:hypothetical protein
MCADGGVIFFFCNRASPGTSELLTAKGIAALDKAAAQIEADLPRTFPRHRAIDTPAGIAALRRVLTAYVVGKLLGVACLGSAPAIAHSPAQLDFY